MEFQQECPKDKKKYSSFNFLTEKLEKFRSTEHYGAPLGGSTIFLCRSSLGSTAMESCRLPELKYAFFRRTGCKTKKLPRSKLFLWTVLREIDIFNSIKRHNSYTIGKLSIRRVRMWNFTRIGPKTKKLWLSINPARRLFEHTGLGTPQKGVNCNFSWPELDKACGVRKLSISNA